METRVCVPRTRRHLKEKIKERYACVSDIRCVGTSKLMILFCAGVDTGRSSSLMLERSSWISHLTLVFK